MNNNTKNYIINNKIDMDNFAINLAKNNTHSVICLTGELGSGKTYIVKNIAKYYGVKDDVISPTFNIIKSYNTTNTKYKKINHFDIYRLTSKEELVDIGFYDYIYDENSLNIIEWADILKSEMPKDALWVNIKVLANDKREISI